MHVTVLIHRTTMLIPFVCGWMMAQDQAPVKPLLTTCVQIRALKPTEADLPHEAQIEGVATVVPRVSQSGLVIQDATDGIWVELGKARALRILEADSDQRIGQLNVGDRVRVEGITERGGFAPVIIPRRIVLLAHACPLPEALPVTIPAVLSGKHDVQRVKLTGVVQHTSVGGLSSPRTLMIKLVNSGGQLPVKVPREALPPEDNLLDTQITISGTLISRHNSRAEMSGALLVTDRAEDVQVLRPATPPFKVPRLSLTSLRPYEPGGFSAFRRRITGTVTLWEPGVRAVLQDGSAAVEVTTASQDSIPLGSLVEAVGFISRPSPICRMENALFRVIEQRVPPEPVGTTAQALLDASRRSNAQFWQRSIFDFHFRLVRLSGTLVESFATVEQQGRTLLLQSGGVLLPVHWNAAPADFGEHWRQGSELEVTGIVEMKAPPDDLVAYEPHGKGDLALSIRSGDDVRILAAAPWWTRQRLITAGWIGAALGALALWLVFALSRRVRTQAAELAERIAQHREAEIRFTATLDERNRLGADMHDGLQQFITGVSVQLQVAKGSLDSGRDAGPALDSAEKLLFHLREDFRHCVNALRDTAAAMHLPTMLEHTAAVIRTCHLVEAQVQITGQPTDLPGRAVANLMLVVQEAANNAARHGRAKSIILRCHFTPDTLKLTIQDDGIGFDASTVSSDKARFGLQNMRSRLTQLGGTLGIEGTPGQGTSVTATLPLPVVDPSQLLTLPPSCPPASPSSS